MMKTRMISCSLFYEPGLIVLDGGDELFFNQYVLDFYYNVLENWEADGKLIALYFGCSHHKPFSKSFIHMKTIRMLKKHDLNSLVQQFILSEPLTICPRELERVFPAANYNFPPQRLGEIGRREFINRLQMFLKKNATKYEYHVVFAPNHHKEIFIEASKGLIEPICVSYNLYRLPELLNILKELKSRIRG